MAQTLKVHHANGAATDLVLDDQTTVKFNDDHVLVSSSKQSRDFAKSDVLTFTYTILRADVNGDNSVDVADIATVISVMAGEGAEPGVGAGPVPARAEADVNGDGAVDVADIAAVINTMAELARRASAGETPALPEASNGTIGEAFYIYRNDGQFNAFFREEIDSIGFSHYDADSLRYNKIASQVVYTPDSTYCIPLVVIDSVSFVQPETILQPNVVQMDKVGLIDYLQAVDGMSLFFRTDIPTALQPRVGQVLLSTDFDSPLLSEGFAGKVIQTQMGSNAFRVDCDSIYDIFDIFEQLISIERIDEEGVATSRRVSDEWISSRNSLNFNLGFSRPVSNGQFSLSGSVNGTYIATVVYNITRKEQYINLKIDHDWQYGAHLNFKKELGSFGTLIGPVAALPAIRFPAVAPVFKFQIAGAPFVKGEGNMELDLSFNSPVHSYVGQAIYRNGNFSGWNHEKPAQGSSGPNVEAAFSLNGSLQVGYMVDFWLGLDISIKGIAKDFLKVGTGLDFYVGPKLSGDFSMKMGSENPVNYYSVYKDSKIGIDWLHVDYEFFGEAALAGHKFPKAMFCNGSIDSPFNHEWYIMPEFSDLSVDKDKENKKVTISTTPTRDILFPLSVGMGLYDSEGSLLSTQYESRNYKRENEGFEISQTFSSLELGKEYMAKPFIKIMGGEVPALPEETFKLDDETSCPDENHPHWIDLGIGTQWRCCNEGASTPEGYGGYYQFGQVASAPTLDQIKALVNNCSYTWTTQNGVNGGKFTGPNGGTIFLPAAGNVWDGELTYVGSDGDYWSSTPYDEYRAYYLGFNSFHAYWGSGYRGRDQKTVRPVR